MLEPPLPFFHNHRDYNIFLSAVHRWLIASQVERILKSNSQNLCLIHKSRVRWRRHKSGVQYLCSWEPVSQGQGSCISPWDSSFSFGSSPIWGFQPVFRGQSSCSWRCRKHQLTSSLFISDSLSFFHITESTVHLLFNSCIAESTILAGSQLRVTSLNKSWRT